MPVWLLAIFSHAAATLDVVYVRGLIKLRFNGLGQGSRTLK